MLIMRKLLAGLAILGGLTLTTAPANAGGYWYHHHYYRHYHHRHHVVVVVRH
jgi:hypothetical protein